MNKRQLDYCKDKRVLLNLNGETRMIGKIDNQTYYKFVDPSKHKFIMSNSIGFNYELIRDGNFDKVEINYGGNILKTTKENIRRQGTILNYQKRGFENQIFLPINLFER